MQKQIINVYTTPGIVSDRIKLNQYDHDTAALALNVYAMVNGALSALTLTGYTVRLEATKPDGHGFSFAGTVSGSTATFDVDIQMTAVAGEFPCELRISNGTDDIGTANVTMVVERAPLNADTDISETELPAIIALAEEQEEAAAASAANAATSASNAASSASAASGSATSASNAASSASAASGSATNAAASAANAATSASNAASSASAASGSATNAAASAANAASSASDAASSASDASDSAEDALDNARKSQSYARGDAVDDQGSDYRQGQATDNALYYKELARGYAESFAGAMNYIGSVAFANLPTAGMRAGFTYNITDAFTTDSRFKDGAGIAVPAGANVIYDNDGLWDVMSPAAVNSFNGRIGAVVPAAGDYDASQISVTDTEGLLGTAGDAVTSQAFADEMASRIVDTESDVSDLQDATEVLPVLVVSCGTISSLPATINNAYITSDMVVLQSTLGTPSAQLSDWTVTTSDGSLTVSGTISDSTTLTLYLMKSR